MLQIALGFLIIFIAIIIAAKIIGNILKIILLVILLFLGFYLIFGYVPYSNKIDIKSIFALSIEGVGRDKDGNTLLLVKNRWFFEAKNISVFFDDSKANILNNITNIKGRNSAIFQLDWKKDFEKIKIVSSIGTSEFKLN